MNKLTVVLNDYASNVKAYITYDRPDIDTAERLWGVRDERLIHLHSLSSFKGYDKWCELTPEHYRVLVTRGLNTLAEMTPEDRVKTSNESVSMTNFIILCFIICLEKRTSSEIEQFRINRFDDLNVTFDYSASYELRYQRPVAKEGVEPAFSIIVDNTDDV